MVTSFIVRVRTSWCTWCSSAKRENFNNFSLSCFCYVNQITRISLVSLTNAVQEYRLKINARMHTRWWRIQVQLICLTSSGSTRWTSTTVSRVDESHVRGGGVRVRSGVRTSLVIATIYHSNHKNITLIFLSPENHSKSCYEILTFRTSRSNAGTLPEKNLPCQLPLVIKTMLRLSRKLLVLVSPGR